MEEAQILKRKEWSTPHLAVFGDVHTLTQDPPHGCVKEYGLNDGDIFQGQPIGCVSHF